ncbi:hypothetical protein SprV_0902688900 [Sparganum proliferum]
MFEFTLVATLMMCTSKPVVVSAEKMLNSIGTVMTTITIMMAFAPCVIVAGIVLLTTAAAMGTSSEMSFAAGASAVVSGLTIMPILVLMRHKAKRVREQTLTLEGWIYKHIRH